MEELVAGVELHQQQQMRMAGSGCPGGGRAQGNE